MSSRSGSLLEEMVGMTGYGDDYDEDDEDDEDHG